MVLFEVQETHKKPEATKTQALHAQGMPQAEHVWTFSAKMIWSSLSTKTVELFAVT